MKLPLRKAVSWLVTASMMVGMGLSAAPAMADEVEHGDSLPVEAELNLDIQADPITDEGELAEIDLTAVVRDSNEGAGFSVLNIVVPGNATKEDLAMAIVGSLINNDPSRLKDVQYEGAKKKGYASSGTFTGGGSIINIEQGAVLTSGKAVDVGAHPNKTWSDDSGSGGDSLLGGMLLSWTTNKSVLEFKFRPVRTGKVSFNYVFGSDEFEKQKKDRRNDGFYFLLDEVKKGYSLDGWDNIAWLGPLTPVSVLSLQDSNLFIDNNHRKDDAKKVAVDGFSQVLATTEKQVEADKWYHVRIAIADAWDSGYDSAVFIGAGSYTDDDTTGPEWPNGAAIEVVEQCGIVTLNWPEATDSSTPVRYEVSVNDRVEATTAERTAVFSLDPGEYEFKVVPSDSKGNPGSALTKRHVVTSTPTSGDGSIVWLTPEAVGNGESFYIKFMKGGCADSGFDKSVAVKVRSKDTNKLLAGFVLNQSITYDEETGVYSQFFDTSRFAIRDTVIKVFVFFGNKLRDTWEVIVGGSH